MISKQAKINEKVSIIGAGSVGAMLAQRILEHDLADVVLLDIDIDLCRAKVSDLEDAAPIMGYERGIKATKDYKDIKYSDIVVITAGLTRKPGMSREDLIRTNGAIVSTVTRNIKEFAPESIIIVVTNPLDIMTYIAYKESGFDRNRVMGMAGVLDSARCSNLAAEKLGVKKTEAESVVIGSHDKKMVPLMRFSKSQGQPLETLLEERDRKTLIERVRGRGAEIVSLLKRGSAFFAPSAACFSMVKSIIKNEHVKQCASVYLDGEYGIKEVCLGLPVILGKKGVINIIELDLSENESAEFRMAAENAKSTLKKLSISNEES